jgi:hypothetical protein
MEELFEAGEIDTPPDTYHYTILLGTWARSGKKFAAERALQILVHMVERTSTFKTFSHQHLLVRRFLTIVSPFLPQRPEFQT